MRRVQRELLNHLRNVQGVRSARWRVRDRQRERRCEVSDEIERAAEALGAIPTPSTAHMADDERADACRQMLHDLLLLARADGCIGAAWAYEWILARLAAERAEREERKLALEFVGCVLTVQKKNTTEWMQWMAEKINDFAAALGETDRCEFRPRRGDMGIVRHAQKGGA